MAGVDMSNPQIFLSLVFGYQSYDLRYVVYIYICYPPGESTVFMGVVRANSRKIFEVEDKFSQNNYFC